MLDVIRTSTPSPFRINLIVRDGTSGPRSMSDQILTPVSSTYRCRSDPNLTPDSKTSRY
jgi:hypothetical protein